MFVPEVTSFSNCNFGFRFVFPPLASRICRTFAVGYKTKAHILFTLCLSSAFKQNQKPQALQVTAVKIYLHTQPGLA